MIAALKGIVDTIDTPYIIVDVNGIGYKVLVSNTILSSLSIGAPIKLFTYTHVREDLLELFGFLHLSDLKLFEKLISISGIGPKTAVGIFTLGTGSEIINAISQGDVTFFSGVPRLGKKNAQKIILELKGKLIDDAELLGSSGLSNGNGEVIAALQHFGFSTREAQDALQNISANGQTTEEKIKLALKYLGK